MEQKHGQIAKAVTLGVSDTMDSMVEQGRANIASAGFPVGFQKALRGRLYPESGYSINASCFIWHRSTYSGIFEDGGTIQGSPLLWLPLSSTIPKVGSSRTTPKLLASKGIDLVSLRTKHGTPLLGAYVGVRTKKQKERFYSGQVSYSMLKRGRSGKGPFATVPLFHGVRNVTISKKFDLEGIAEKQQAALPGRIANHFEDEE
jgi:hypothetical protein